VSKCLIAFSVSIIKALIKYFGSFSTSYLKPRVNVFICSLVNFVLVKFTSRERNVCLCSFRCYMRRVYVLLVCLVFCLPFWYTVYIISSNGKLIEFWLCCHIPLNSVRILGIYDIIVDWGSASCSRKFWFLDLSCIWSHLLWSSCLVTYGRWLWCWCSLVSYV